jgi:hypothetical protein
MRRQRHLKLTRLAVGVLAGSLLLASCGQSSTATTAATAVQGGATRVATAVGGGATSTRGTATAQRGTATSTRTPGATPTP